MHYVLFGNTHFVKHKINTLVIFSRPNKRFSAFQIVSNCATEHLEIIGFMAFQHNALLQLFRFGALQVHFFKNQRLEHTNLLQKFIPFIANTRRLFGNATITFKDIIFLPASNIQR